MSEKVNIAVTSYDKNKFQQTVNTQFTQFGITATQPIAQTLSVNDFFNAYDSLFFQIPKLGEINSHEYLVKKSSAYIGVVSTNDEVQALLDEITQLRQDNLELQQTILTLQTPS